MRIKFTKQKIDEFIKQGRGSGELAFYKPWILTRELTGAPSRKARIKGLLTGRVHHLLSDLEKKIFYQLEWLDNVYDIREQFPLLPNTETIRISEAYGLRHPIYPYTSLPIVMTTDFLVTKYIEGSKKYIAICAKYSKDLDKPRTLEKIHIEKKFWEYKGIDFRIFTEKDINTIILKNILEFRNAYECSLINEIGLSLIDEIKKNLLGMIFETNRTVKETVEYLDTAYKLQAGYSFFIFKHMVAQKIIPMKMEEPFNIQKKFLDVVDYQKIKIDKVG